MEMQGAKTWKKGSVVLEAGSSDGVAIISIVNPPFNLLSVHVLLNLKEKIEEALLRDDVKAMVLTGSKGKFSAGFNVTTFGGSQPKKTRRDLGFMSLEFFTDLLEASKKPIVAAIEGPAFGGGLEIALACHARISTASAQLGLTELEYGLIPGLGGTQRLPRLVGIRQAIKMIIMSKRVDGDKALSLGFVDAISPSHKLLETARQWALDILECKKPWVVSLYKTDKLQPLAEARLIFQSARSQIQTRTPNLKHPIDCIDVMEEGIVSGPRNGLWKEVEVLEELRQSNTCRSLVHIFFAQRKTSKIPGVSDVRLLSRKMKKVAIVVEGVEGSDIATMLILSSVEVIMKEVNEKSQSDGVNRVKASLQRYINGGNLTPEKQTEALSLLKNVQNYASFEDVDLVIEATTGSLLSKQQIFADLEKYCSQCCIFASSNSFTEFRLIAERTKSHKRIMGINFFSPVADTRMLELVCTDRTSPQVIIDVIAFTRKIGKTPVVVKSSTGFAMKRMISLYLHSASFLSEHVADTCQIDQALIKFGMQLGPLRLTNLIGSQFIDVVGTHDTQNCFKRSYKSRLIQATKGVRHEGNSGHKTNFSLDATETCAESVCDAPIDLKQGMSERDITEMVLLPVLNEACRIIEEGIAFKASDVDVASVLGLGFPAFRGGIIFWADSLGSRYICSRLEGWSKEYGELFRPCSYLVHQAAERKLMGSPMKLPKSQL